MPVRELISRLQSPDPAERNAAIDALARLRSQEAAGALVLVLSDADPTVRRRAAAALAGFGTAALDLVVDGLTNWDGPLDPPVADLLGRLGSERGIGILTAHLAERDVATRTAIARALGDIGTARAVPGLLELLRDLAADVRIAAARALGRLRAKDAVDALLDEVNDDNPEVRIAAIEALGQVGSRKAVDTIARAAAEDPSPDVRDACVRAMRGIGTRTVEPLIRLLASGSLSGRISAMNSLLEEGKTAILPLTELLDHDSPAVRCAAVEVLGVMAAPSALEAIVKAGCDPDSAVRLSAAHALGRIRQPNSAEALAAMLEDDDAKVAGAAAGALEQLGECALDPTIGLLSSQRPETRVRAIDVLGRLRDAGVCERLIARLGDATGWVRIVAAQALGEIGDPKATRPLIAALADHNALVRAMAAEALGKLRDYRATMALLDRLKDSSELVHTNVLRALGMIGNPVALPFLLSALDSPSVPVRVAAIEGIALLRATDCLPRLRPLTRPWPTGREPRAVKAAARWAVGVLESAAVQGTLGEPVEREPDRDSG